jgi:hypothetical protein
MCERWPVIHTGQFFWAVNELTIELKWRGRRAPRAGKLRRATLTFYRGFAHGLCTGSVPLDDHDRAWRRWTGCIVKPSDRVEVVERPGDEFPRTAAHDAGWKLRRFRLSEPTLAADRLPDRPEAR